jgi:phage-related protein
MKQSLVKFQLKNFLDKQDHSVLQKIFWTLKLIEENERVPEKYFKKLKNSDGIWEIRIKVGSNIYRIFSFWDKNNLIILTHGIIKKTQKTPMKEIHLAHAYKDDYFRRKK